MAAQSKLYKFDIDGKKIQLFWNSNFASFVNMSVVERKQTVSIAAFDYGELVKFRDFINKVLDENKPK